MEEQNPSTRFHKLTCRLALSMLSLVVIVAIAVGALYGLGRIFVALEPVLLPLVVAGVLAYLLYPCVLQVQKCVKKRALAVIIVLALAAVGIAGMGVTIIPPLVKQTGELIANRHDIMNSAASVGRNLLESNKLVQNAVDTLYAKTAKDAAQEGLSADVPVADETMSYTDKVVTIIEYNSTYLTDTAISWLTAGTRAVYGAAAFLIGVVMVPVFLFYFLLESEAITHHWHDILPLRRSRFRKEVVETLQQINGYIISFVRGQMLVSLIDGILLGVALKIMGLPYAITIACTAALLGIIPYIGMISTSIPALLIAWFTWHDLSHVIAVAAIFVAVSQFDGWVIQPRIVGNRVGMHDMTVMFSVLFWSLVLGGVVGALLAVPLTAAIKVIFMRYVWSSLGEQEGAQKKGGQRRRHRRRNTAPPETL